MQSLHVIKIWDLNKKLHKTQTEYIYNVDNENISYRSPVCSPLMSHTAEDTVNWYQRTEKKYYNNF